MPPRPIWSGSVSFGLVNVPVRMLAATESKELRFHFVDRTDRGPDGTVYARSKGRYVPIDPDDLDRLDVELAHAVDICDFVALDEIDPIYFRQAYYLVPQEGAETPFRLLARALDETGRVGIAKVVIRNKQHLACLRPYRDVLLLETMYYADEVRDPPVDAGDAPLRDAEVEMAKTLVENLSAEFDPAKYDDRYRHELMELIRAKAEGQELPEPAQPEGEVVDLMQSLRESVERTKRARRSRARTAS